MKIGVETAREFYTMRGVRKGCPLNPLLFNIVFAKLKKEIRSCQEAGLVILRKKMYGAEIWEWNESEELERVNERFIR